MHSVDSPQTANMQGMLHWGVCMEKCNLNDIHSLVNGILMTFIALFAQGDMCKQSVNRCPCVCSCLQGAILLMMLHA